MKDKLLSRTALATAFVPFTVLFVWDPASPSAAAVLIGYCVFATASFFYALFLFANRGLRDLCTKIALGIHSVYVAAILLTVVFPRLH